MIRQFLLRLYWAQFSTKQIYQFLMAYPNVIKEDCGKKDRYLCEWVKREENVHLLRKYYAFIKLDHNVIIKELQKLKVSYMTYMDTEYPVLLKEIYQFPLLLFYKGNIKLINNRFHLAVVGARDSTSYTLQALDFLLSHDRSKCLTIVSGLARGADSMAHQIALKYNLPTIAVLAFGHKTHYPKSTLTLRNKIEEKGLVISEYPPHTPIAKYRFPERNRIISGLSKGVLITEAKEQSGSHITIDFALEQNRNVYVLPGSMFNPMTKGNLLRIQEGAKVVLNANDILEDYYI
ncbi:DNA-processing protein DprA [Staphylococcus schweitzeri]|uniref:SMF family protein n=1 Tax=Staphylococcus schweitzeri TaxID=1654388 RepID=A0A077UDV6_9STAP|nr:DNA-processing protein DprA [Staphylococcus schweitzeri]CDR26684.1 SMF family protein [Staphylococcus schweitzeri]